MTSADTYQGADDALLTRVRSADARVRRAAFEELVAAYHGRVYRLCHGVTNNQADAEEACQDVFVAVYRGLDGFRGQARLATWIYRITLRTAARVRARSRHRQEVPESASTNTSNSQAGDRGRAMARIIDRDRLRIAMGRLGLEHRTVLLLVLVEGLRHTEVAQILGIPVGTVWSRLHYARKLLRRELENL